MKRHSQGFSLLEIMVAVAILGLGLTAILSAQAGSFASAAHARNISLATGLARCKMSEIEQHLAVDGFQETDESGQGACCLDDVSPMRCAWHVEKPVFPEAKLGDLNLSAGLDTSSPSPGGAPGGMGSLGLLSQIGSPGGGPSPLSGASSVGDLTKVLSGANTTDPAAGPAGGDPSSGIGGLMSMGMSLVYPTLRTIFEASTRRITTKITWREGIKEYSIDVVEWYTIPQRGVTPDTSALDELAGQQGSGSGSSGGSGSRSGTGAPKSPLGGSGRGN